MPDIRKPLIRAVTDNIQIRSKEVITTSYGFGKVFAGITLSDNIDLDNYITPGVARLSANYQHGPSITNQPAFIIVYAVNQDEEREKPTNAKVQVAADSEEKPDTSSWKGRERYRQIYYPDSGSDNTPYTRTGTRDKSEDGTSNGSANNITWGSWTSIAGSKIDQQLSSHEGRITILEMNTMMFSRHDFNTAGWKKVKTENAKVQSASQTHAVIPNDIEAGSKGPITTLEQMGMVTATPEEGGTASSGHITAIEDSNKTYEYTFVTNHFTHTHVYEFETNKATTGEQQTAASQGNNAANSSNATGSHCVDSEVEVHILGSTETEDIQREIKIVSHKTFNGYIITLGAITPPEFNAVILKKSNKAQHQKNYHRSWEEDVAMITGIKRNPSNVSAIYIPSVIEIDGTIYNVKVVESNAINGNPWITKVIFGEGIEVYNAKCLWRLNRLTDIVLPSTLKVFRGQCLSAAQVTSLSLPEGLLEMSSDWQYGFSGIKGKLRIPASLEYIDNTCSSTGTYNSFDFEGYEVAEGNKHFEANSEGYLMSKGGLVLYGIPGNKYWFTVPRSCKILSPGLLYFHSRVRGITIPEGVIIAPYLIESCDHCKLIYFPSTLLSSRVMTNWRALPSLLAFSVGKGSTIFQSEGGLLYNNGKKKLIAAPAGKKYGLLKIDDSCEIIGVGSLKKCRIGILDLNKVKNIDQLGCQECGVPGDGSSLIHSASSSTDVKWCGLCCIIPNSISYINPFGPFMTTRFNKYFMWPKDNAKYSIRDRFLLERREDAVAKASTEQKYWLLAYLHRPADEAAGGPTGKYEQGDEVTLPADVDFKTDAGHIFSYGSLDVKKINMAKTSIDTIYAMFGGSNYELEIIFPKSLVKLQNDGSAFLANTTKEVHIPENTAIISTGSIYISRCPKIYFHSKLKLGEKISSQKGEGQETAKSRYEDHTCAANSVFSIVRSDCIVVGYKGSYSENIAAQYTLKFQEMTEEDAKKYEECYTKCSNGTNGASS